ncbi:hypothetical protein EVAR_81227_1 [Eumeta japonica]|uniref:Uncharacterized protein n=1 Tax=Eumeta variegata TaxID=151549 RepID=A0A4C1V1L4_EUMVA|nr:hypothetical protein EVAR_81227_1 [Eumeta japonica]
MYMVRLYEARTDRGELLQNRTNTLASGRKVLGSIVTMHDATDDHLTKPTVPLRVEEYLNSYVPDFTIAPVTTVVSRHPTHAEAFNVKAIQYYIKRSWKDAL